MNNDVTATCDSTVIVEMLSPLFSQYISTIYSVSTYRNSSFHARKREYPRRETVVPSLGTGVWYLAIGSCNSYVAHTMRVTFTLRG